MRLDEILVESTESFLDEVVNNDENEILTASTDALRLITSEEADWLEYKSEIEILEEIQSHVDDIWNQISEGEKCKNRLLKNFYEVLVEHIEQLMTACERVIAHENDWDDDDYSSDAFDEGASEDL